VAKVNLAVDRLPAFTALRDLPAGIGPDQALAGRILIAPGIDDLESAYDHAKYGDWSAHPWLECVIPTIADPDLAPAGQHVLSIYAQYVPHRLRGHAWDDARGHVLQAVIETLMAYAPGVRSSIVAAEVLTPADLEREHGLTGGHIHHGEQALDQLYLMRPTLGWARYRTPYPRALSLRCRHPPRRRPHRPERRPGGPRGARRSRSTIGGTEGLPAACDGWSTLTHRGTIAGIQAGPGRRLEVIPSGAAALRPCTAVLLVRPGTPQRGLMETDTKTTMKITYATMSAEQMADLHNALDAAIADVKGTFGKTYPLVINGREVEAGARSRTRAPSTRAG
jgi:hypothetical protein